MNGSIRYTHKHKPTGTIYYHVKTIDGRLSVWETWNAWGRCFSDTLPSDEMEELSSIKVVDPYNGRLLPTRESHQ